MPVYKDYNDSYYFRTYVLLLGNSKQITRRGFKTKNEALRSMQRVEAEGEASINNMTFQQLYDNYVGHYFLKNRGQSFRRIKSYFTIHILPFFKDARVVKISSSDYLEWKRLILNKELSDSFNKGLHGSMVTILNHAMKFYGLDKNIAKETGGFKKTYRKKPKSIWSFEEYEQYISVIDDLIDKALFSTLYETGIRYGELAALQWSDFDGKTINVNKTISKEFDGNKKHIINDPKTRSSKRVITLSDNVIKLLKELKEHFTHYVCFDDSWFIFGGIKPYSHTTANNHKKRYCELAKVKRITLHEFRHSHVSLLINSGVPITDISERLGHADASITLGIYSHMLRKEKDPVIEVLNNLGKH